MQSDECFQTVDVGKNAAIKMLRHQHNSLSGPTLSFLRQAMAVKFYRVYSQNQRPESQSSQCVINELSKILSIQHIMSYLNTAAFQVYGMHRLCHQQGIAKHHISQMDPKKQMHITE